MSAKIKKERADLLLLKQGLCESQELAKKLIIAGKVRIGSDHVISKPSELISSDIQLNVVHPCPYVSRGAYKLLPAIEKYLPDMTGLIAFDVGASTGGFTDLMLQRGAEKVYTVDVGTAQLHSKLRDDPRVISREKVNARNLEDDFLPEKIDAITMDVSFISVTKILPATLKFLKRSGVAFILVKPQFEARRKDVEKGGVVRDESVIKQCIDNISYFATSELNIKDVNMEVLEVIQSPLKGPKGNQESILILKNIAD